MLLIIKPTGNRKIARYPALKGAGPGNQNRKLTNVFGRVTDQGKVTDQKYDDISSHFPASRLPPPRILILIFHTNGLNMGRVCQQKDSTYEERKRKAIQVYRDGIEPNLHAAGEAYDIT